MATVYFSLGSNLGNRQENLDKALDLMSQRLRVDKVSSVYETDPVDNPDQPKFLNLACRAVTGLQPAGLLLTVKGIESRLGRMPNTTKLPRPIDIDILFYDNQAIDTPELVIPHPRLTERAFVLVPLAEIAPELVHQANGKTIAALLAELKQGVQGVLKLDAGGKS